MILFLWLHWPSVHSGVVTLHCVPVPGRCHKSAVAAIGLGVDHQASAACLSGGDPQLGEVALTGFIVALGGQLFGAITNDVEDPLNEELGILGCVANVVLERGCLSFETWLWRAGTIALSGEVMLG